MAIPQRTAALGGEGIGVKRDDITVSVDRRDAICAAELLQGSGNQHAAKVADILLAAARPGPDQIDLDRRYDSRTNAIQYLGMARRQPNGLYRVLANVGGALCIVEASLHFDVPPAEAPRVAIGEDVPQEVGP